MAAICYGKGAYPGNTEKREPQNGKELPLPRRAICMLPPMKPEFIKGNAPLACPQLLKSQKVGRELSF